ncbi:hypothetical protein BBR15_14760, partial [Salmonella enterica subsp. enterica serovar Newport]|nr:hypothetical protein [Salmonella enterica subsp. enterica serovar Newport]
WIALLKSKYYHPYQHLQIQFLLQKGSYSMKQWTLKTILETVKLMQQSPIPQMFSTQHQWLLQVEN